MKRRINTGIVLCVMTMFLLLTGCGAKEGSASRVSGGNAVEQVLEEQTDVSSAEAKEAVQEKKGSDKKEESFSAEVDYDLTAMNSDMVYATVYQMMSDPDRYIGKTFCMEGIYYTSYYDNTDTRYHFCVIEDAAACCSQGLEFVWGDGSHIYPEEYPKEGGRVKVEGTFATYREEGDENLYCRLENASLEQ
ncbi:MAG: hypothetical protein Q4D60_06440 [Eubacteriales bacterium]|nr:hypothetical protein [Eubacteriales bacterium]